MSTVQPSRERRQSFGPTVYHDDDDTNLARPPRVFYDELNREKPRRSSSTHSRHAPARHESVRYHYQEPVNVTSPVQSQVKPAFIETVEEKRFSEDDRYDEKGFEEKIQYVEKPFGDDDRSFVEVAFSQRNSHIRPQQAPIARYAPPKLGKPVDPKKLWWAQVREVLRDPFSEFCGTFILVLFGDGSIAQVVLSNRTKGGYQDICWGWGIGVMLGVYVAGVSGANLNPAVTLSNCIFRKHPWQKLPVYALGQTLGAFCAAGVVYANYVSAINRYEGGSAFRTVPGTLNGANSTAGIFATYPAPFVNKTADFFSEFIASGILMFCVYALQDKFNRGADKFVPLALFFVIYGIGAAFGWETGYAINPARDFGPRLMTYVVGYGNEVWSASGHYFWVPLIAPLFGCVFGGWLYDLLIFTGESPVNTPWLGLRRICRPGLKNDSPPV